MGFIVNKNKTLNSFSNGSFPGYRVLQYRTADEVAMKAIVLIKLASLETRDSYQILKRLKPVTESYMVYGRYDVVVFIQAGSLEEIRSIILSEIQPIPGVIEILPSLIVEDQVLAEQGLPG